MGSSLGEQASGGRKALFLDRDGTLIHDRNYLSDPAGVELIPGVADALDRAVAAGYLLFLFTNQSAVGRGYCTLEDVMAVNRRMEQLLNLPHPGFVAVGIAPEAPWEPVIYRKPSPRFILEMLESHGIDPAQSFMVGDGAGDVEAGLAAGVRAALVATGKAAPPTELEPVRKGEVPVFADLPAFVDWLVEHGGSGSERCSSGGTLA